VHALGSYANTPKVVYGWFPSFGELTNFKEHVKLLCLYICLHQVSILSEWRRDFIQAFLKMVNKGL